MSTEVKDVFVNINKMIADESPKWNDFNISNVTICMVPETLRKLNPSAYTPQMTSIGPLHKGDNSLREMEKHKVTYMYQLLNRTGVSMKKTMEDITIQCVEEILRVVNQARACYAPSFTYYDDSKLAEMMVIDGCFILELFYRFRLGIRSGDPILYNTLVSRAIKNDLLLLENQIPFFILDILFRLTVKQIIHHASLTDFVIYFFEDMNFINHKGLAVTVETVEHCHILGFIQSCYRPIGTNPVGAATYNLYSATEISAIGVRFETQRNANSLLAVSFGSGSVNKTCLQIPALFITNSTPTLLRNLIAYEMCYTLSSPYVTSFVFLMQTLIGTEGDVSLLVRSKVLQHNMGATEDVTNLFQDLCNRVPLKNFYYTEQLTQLDDYCNLFRPRILISSRRHYISTMISLNHLFRSTTWKILTVIAGMMFFTLELVQTIYTAQKA